MPSEKEAEFSVPEDMKSTIARVIALFTLTTDPSHIVRLASSLLHWVKAGLIMKYGDWSAVPEEYQDTFMEDRDAWQKAMKTYGVGSEHWPDALLIAHDIADDMITIAAFENMLDYRQIDYNFSSHMFGPNANEVEQNKEQVEREKSFGRATL